MLGPIVIWTALGLIAAGVIVSWRALWQWLTRGRLLMAAGFVLLLVAIYGLDGM